MDAELYRRVRELLDEALSLPPDARASFLDRACANDTTLRREIESLLAHEGDATSIADAVRDAAEKACAMAADDDRPAGREDESASTQPPTATSPETKHIGPYRILQRLGEGGMGEVWLAEQTEPIRRQVALKVIKRGMDTKQVIARFEAERQALALMNHPSVAKVFDAGATPEGRPYFAMEYVRGIPITEHCDRHRLTTGERLQLFGQVCDGVQHAHQKAIIHRDLKPSNVLVSIEGDHASPKIIDFGLAKATAQSLTERTMFTEHGVLIGTPEYMSPEQADLTGQDIDTRTDVYSLGVILYQLLAGALPFDPKELRRAGLEGIRRKIQDEEPPRPSTRVSTLGEQSAEAASRRRTDIATLRKSLRGDLDWITMKALEKDRTRRYSSPSEFAEDIQRHLRHEPALASPPSALYRTRKFARRHRVGVSVAVATVLMLVAFATTMAVQADRIAQERDRAERVSEFLGNMLGDVDPDRLGTALMTDLRERVEETHRNRDASEEQIDAAVASFESSMRGVNPTDAALRLIDEEILERAAAKIDPDLAEEPLIAAQLERKIAGTYYRLGMLDQAKPHAERAIEIRKQALGEEHPETSYAMNTLAFIYHDQVRYQEADSLFTLMLRIQRSALGGDDRATLHSMQMVADMHRHLQRFSEAESLYVAALAMQQRVLGEEDSLTVYTMSNLASMLSDLGRYAESESLSRQVVDISRRVLGESHFATLHQTKRLAGVLVKARRPELYAEAETLLTSVLERSMQLHGDEHPLTLGVLYNLKELYHATGRPEQERAIFTQLLPIRRAAAIKATASAMDKNVYAWELLTCPVDLRDPHEALRFSIEANEMAPYPYADYLDTLACAYYQTGDTAKAVETQRAAVDLKSVESADRAKLEARLADYEAALAAPSR